MKTLTSIVFLAGLLGAGIAKGDDSVLSDMAQELIQNFVSENYSYGDDGIDCSIDLHEISLLQSDESPVKKTFKYLYQFKALQPVEVHGCGLRFSCHALIQKDRSTEKIDLVWAHCKI